MGAVPIELLLSGRDLTEARIDPTGSRVTVVARSPGGPARVLLVPVDGGPEREVALGIDIAAGRGDGGGATAWMPSGDTFVVAGRDGELHRGDLHGGSRPLTARGRSTRMPAVSADGRYVVSVVDEAEVWLTDLHADREYRIDDGEHDFCMDPAIRVVNGDIDVRWQAWSVPDMAWDRSVIVRFVMAAPDGPAQRSLVGTAQTTQPRFLADGSLGCLRDDYGWLNVWIDDHALVDEPCEHGNPTWGPGAVSFTGSPSARTVALCRNDAGFGRLVLVDRSSGATTDIGRGVHSSLSWAGEHLVAIRSGARTPTQVVSYRVGDDRADAPVHRTTLMVGPAVGWEAYGLPEPEVHRVDGPAGAVFLRRYAAGGGTALVMVHGGPTDQWRVEFNPRIAYWWSRGVDVVVVDPRGTTGHGREFAQALRGGWGVHDVVDVRAAIDHVHAAGWASPATTAVAGSSSGGLTVLGVLCSATPPVAAGVATYPVSDLAALLNVDHRYEAHYPLGLVGPAGDPAYDIGSPMMHIGRLGTPLLLLHGTDDPVVPIEQSRRLVAGAPDGLIDYHEFEGEGHGFSAPASRRREFELMERFLGEHIGSR